MDRTRSGGDLFFFFLACAARRGRWDLTERGANYLSPFFPGAPKPSRTAWTHRGQGAVPHGREDDEARALWRNQSRPSSTENSRMNPGACEPVFFNIKKCYLKIKKYVRTPLILSCVSFQEKILLYVAYMEVIVHSTTRKGTDLPSRSRFSPDVAATPATKKKTTILASSPLSRFLLALKNICWMMARIKVSQVFV
jgi:hypothetical protein